MRKIKWIFIMSFAISLIGCKDEPVDNVDDIPKGLPGNVVNAIHITDDGLVYFATDKGIASFDGSEWTVYYSNPKVTTGFVHDMDFEVSAYGPEFWLGTNKGVNVVSLPIDATSGATMYTKENTQSLFPGQPGLLGDSIIAVKVDENNMRWYGTNGGLSVFRGNKWPTINYGSHYRANFFTNNRITSIDSSNDTVYIGTMGGGIARVVTTNPDAISGASPYEIPWSMIPTENILSVYIDGNNKWFGSDDGLAKHFGNEAKDNWFLYYDSEGLVDNYVQAINKDLDGNMWFGTKGGVSKYDGTTFTNYTTQDGLPGNNVLCIAIGKDGTIWLGTDHGVSHFNGNTFTNYQAEE